MAKNTKSSHSLPVSFGFPFCSCRTWARASLPQVHCCTWKKEIRLSWNSENEFSKFSLFPWIWKRDFNAALRKERIVRKRDFNVKHSIVKAHIFLYLFIPFLILLIRFLSTMLEPVAEVAAAWAASAAAAAAAEDAADADMASSSSSSSRKAKSE